MCGVELAHVLTGPSGKAQARAGMPNPYLVPTVSIEQAADLLGVGRAAGYKGVKSGDIPSIKIGKRRRVRVADLYAMLCLPLPSAPD